MLRNRSRYPETCVFDLFSCSVLFEVISIENLNPYFKASGLKTETGSSSATRWLCFGAHSARVASRRILCFKTCTLSVLQRGKLSGWARGLSRRGNEPRATLPAALLFLANKARTPVIMPYVSARQGETSPGSGRTTQYH